MSKIYYCVEYGGTDDKCGASYGSSLVRAKAEAALARAEARGMTSLRIRERATRPNVVGWLTPCDTKRYG